MKTPRLAAVILAALWALVLAAGCNEQETASGSAAVTSPSAAGASIWAPDVSDLPSTMAMTADQKAALGAALERFQKATADNPACTLGGRGPRGGRGHGARSDEGAQLHGKEPPFLTLLGEAADILSVEQFGAFAGHMAEQREAQREQMSQVGKGHGGPGQRGGRGPGDGERRILDGLADEVGLTAEQRAEVQAAADSMRVQMDALRERCGEEGRDRAECRDAAREIHEGFRAELETILTADQLAKLEELRSARHEERTERAEACADDRHDRMADLLTRALDLTAEQEQQVRSMLDGTIEKHRALHEQVQSGEVEREAVQAQMEALRDESQAAIRALLTPEQQTAFDALQDLMPGHGPGPCMGGGPGGPPF